VAVNLQLKAKGWGKAKIILEVWGVSKGGSPKYKAAEAEYRRLVGGCLKQTCVPLHNNLETRRVYRGGEWSTFRSVVRGRFFQKPYGFREITFSPIATESDQKSIDE
jgi:hypothetical protein